MSSKLSYLFHFCFVRSFMSSFGYFMLHFIKATQFQKEYKNPIPILWTFSTPPQKKKKVKGKRLKDQILQKEYKNLASNGIYRTDL